MTDKLQAFVNAANSTLFDSRDIIVDDENKVKLGNLIFSEKAKTNKNTLNAFRAAMAERYGVFGEHAFDTVMNARVQNNKPLRACDVRKTLSQLEHVKKKRFSKEITRQLDTDPAFRELPKDTRAKIRNNLWKQPFTDVKFKEIKDEATLFKKVSERISSEINYVIGNDSYQKETLGDVITDNKKIADDTATGLTNLKVFIGNKDTSVEDHVKSGNIGVGMRINRSQLNPLIFEKLKDNGVEPGFNYHHDWSLNDSRSLMQEWESEESIQILENLKKQNDKLREECGNLPLREQIMKCGYAHPAVISAVADFIIEQEMKNPESEMYKAFQDKLPHYNPDNYQEVDPETLKKTLFLQIREAVLKVKSGPVHDMSPVFKHFSERHIMKLDYNESQRIHKKEAAHTGKFMRPERVALNRKFGQLYRITSAQKADDISAGAVTEALANDLSRIAGIPTQDLRIVRTKYSDGHPKIMLEAKYANGYKDLERGYIKNGRISPPQGEKVEKLGKYKAFFLTTADRDGIGSRGQNKGFANGKFFAIDPGHSLEGNGKYLELEDDLSFKDTYGFSTKPRFNNFSIFDDDTRFNKLQGVVKLRDLKKEKKIEQLFREYKVAFDTKEPGIDETEYKLRKKVTDGIVEKEKEFNESLQKLLNVADNQLHLYDELQADGPDVQEKAVNTIDNLEKLTSPTTWVSNDGTVPLEHLHVIKESRVAWAAHVDGDSIVYNCDEPLSGAAKGLLQKVAQNSGAVLEIAADGTAKLTVSKENREQFFEAFSEKNVAKETHPEEAENRRFGGDGLLEAKVYTSPLINNTPAQTSSRPPFEIPANLSVSVGDTNVIFVKSQYEQMVLETPDALRPKNVEELKALIKARVEKGREILKDVLAGNGFRHKATTRNVASLTLALHAATLNKKEFNERGAFSISDPDGRLYQWMDTCKEVYTRTSTHAKQYHHDTVDGHMNMPRGLDIPTGVGGLMGGMKTLHYFALPAVNGQPRRLYLKTETHGIYNSTISKEEDQKSRSPGMQCRGKRSTDMKESLLHCGSLATVFTRKGDNPGNRKEDFPSSVRQAMNNAVTALNKAGFNAEAKKLVVGNESSMFTKNNGGIRQLLQNMTEIMQISRNEEDQVKIQKIMNEVLQAVDAYAEETAEGGNLKRSGNIAARIGNEVMLDPKDFDFKAE